MQNRDENAGPKYPTGFISALSKEDLNLTTKLYHILASFLASLHCKGSFCNTLSLLHHVLGHYLWRIGSRRVKSNGRRLDESRIHQGWKASGSRYTRVGGLGPFPFLTFFFISDNMSERERTHQTHQRTNGK